VVLFVFRVFGVLGSLSVLRQQGDSLRLAGRRRRLAGSRRLVGVLLLLAQELPALAEDRRSELLVRRLGALRRVEGEERRGCALGRIRVLFLLGLGGALTLALRRGFSRGGGRGGECLHLRLEGEDQGVVVSALLLQLGDLRLERGDGRLGGRHLEVRKACNGSWKEGLSAGTKVGW